MTSKGKTQAKAKPQPQAEVSLKAELHDLQGRLAELEAKLRGTFKSGREPGSTAEVLLVDIGAIRAAFELECIQEVVPAAALRPIPEAPHWVLGALNLRGRTTPVVDIRSRLMGGSRELEVDDLIVIVATELGSAGLVVSSVGTILEIKLDEKASLSEAPHAAYVVGTFTQGGQTRLLLGIREILRHADVSVFASLREEAS